MYKIMWISYPYTYMKQIRSSKVSLERNGNLVKHISNSLGVVWLVTPDTNHSFTRLHPVQCAKFPIDRIWVETMAIVQNQPRFTWKNRLLTNIKATLWTTCTYVGRQFQTFGTYNYIVHSYKWRYRANALIRWWLRSAGHDIKSNFELLGENHVSDWWSRHLLWNCPNMNVTGLQWWSVNIGSGNGLVPSGNKPLHAPMLTQISVAIWRH